MIVLHNPKIIALKAIKTGGTSFEIALSKYATKSSIITPISLEDENLRRQLGFAGPQNHKEKISNVIKDKEKLLKTIYKKNLPFRYWNHIPAKEAKLRLGDEIWDAYTKISIIRNPFDLAVSLFFWKYKKEEERKSVDFESFVLSNYNLRRLPYNKDIYEIDGNNEIDFMIKYETLQEDVKDLENKFPELYGINEEFENINAKTKYRPEGASIDKMYEHAPRALKVIYEVHKEQIEKYDLYVPQCGNIINTDQ